MFNIKGELKRFYYLVRHELGFPKGTLTLFILKVIVIVIPLLYTIAKWHYGWILLVGYLVLIVVTRREDFSPKHVQLVKDGYKGRKGIFASVIGELSKGVDFGKVDKGLVRQHALDMIVSYTRGYRSDVQKTKIFTCLLVQENGGKDIHVLMRDTDSAKKRGLDAVYPAKGMLAQKCFSLKDVQFTGDVKTDYPGTPVGKEYNSVLCVPMLGPETQCEVLAVVSIDSTEPYHFDKCVSDLHTALMPYLALIEMTFRA